MLMYFSYLKNRYLCERAQGIVEYALLLAFVVVVATVLIGNGTTAGANNSIAKSISDIFKNVQGKLSLVK